MTKQRFKGKMKRRQFLKNAITGAAGMSALASGLSQATEGVTADRSGMFDTIVIGGGFAGVTAARDASQKGLNTLLLEARPRLGGRTFTTQFAGHDIDMGGTWFGWGQPHIWAERMRYDLPIKESAASRAEKYVWYSKNQRNEGGADQFGPLSESANDKFYAPAREMFPRPYDPLYAAGSKKFQALDKISAAEAIDKLDLSAAEKDLVKSFAAINGHSVSANSSYLDQLRWIALGGFNQAFMWSNLGQYRLDGGTRTLLDKMHADGEAELKQGEAVKSVEQKNGMVQVTTSRGNTYYGKTAIVALPLNTLSNIEFKPALSSVKIKASQQGHTGSGSKVYMRIKGKHSIMFGQGTEDMPFNFYWTEYDDQDSQVMVGFNSSPKFLDVNDDEEIQKAIRLFQPEAELLESFSYDWNLDPYSKGTWCMYPPGMLTGALQELQRPEQNIYFAGSDIANGWRGFIDGAIESGARAAYLVSEKLGPVNKGVKL